MTIAIGAYFLMIESALLGKILALVLRYVFNAVTNYFQKLNVLWPGLPIRNL